MPSLLLIDDPDPERRQRAARAGATLIHEWEGKVPSSFERAGVTVMWAGGMHVPVDHHSNANRDTLLIGDHISGPGSSRTAAANYIPGDAGDGLHIALAVSDREGWTAAADILGILPLYYWVAGNVRLVASAPGLFRASEDFEESLDHFGLVGLLVIGTLFEGRTILRGVRRINPGQVLRALPGESLREGEQFRVPISATHHALPLEECAHRMHESLVAACGRHVEEGVPHALLLSGGHDSRLLAGIMARLGRRITAVTRGATSDNDYRSARRVARQLGFPHQLGPPDGPGNWEGFQRAIRRHGMATNPGLGTSGVSVALVDHSRSVSGYIMDAILGGSNNWWGYSERKRTLGFDVYLGKLNQHAVSLEVLRRLLRPEVFGDTLNEVLHAVRERFDSCGDNDAERTWRFALRHRQRFHLGIMLVRQTETVWPRAPHLDRDVIATAGGIPFGMLGGRLLERDMLARFHPRLARIPVDRGGEDAEPITSDLRGILRDLPDRLVRRMARKLRLPTTDRRYYEREFSMDSAGWHAVRRGAEAARPAAHALFDAATYDALLPRVGEPWPEGFRRVDVLGRRLLLGTAAWAAAT